MSSKSKRKANLIGHVYAGDDRTPAVSVNSTTVLNATRKKRARVVSTKFDVIPTPKSDSSLNLPSHSMIENSYSLTEDSMSVACEEEGAEDMGAMEHKRVRLPLVIMSLSGQ
jgi:hypothetical protein